MSGGQSWTCGRRGRLGAEIGGSVAALLLALGLCAPAAAESLREALHNAYRTNPRLDAERARLRATDEDLPRAKSGFRPNVQASADVGTQKVKTDPRLTGDGNTNPANVGVSVSQSVFSGMRTVNSVREAEAGVRAGRENLRNVEQQVLLEAITAYADVLRDGALIRLREGNVAALTQDLEAAQARRSVREVTKTDVAQATARRAKAISALDLAKSNLRASRAIYERVVGRPPDGLSEPAPPVKLLPASVEEAIKIAERESPNVVSALFREKAARHTVDKIWGELLPEVKIEGSYSHRYDPTRSIDEQSTTAITGRMTVPLYQGGETHARVRQAKHTHVSRVQEIEQARGETQANVVVAWSKMAAARAQLISDKAQVEAAKIALEGTREEERVGQRTLLDVLNAEQELLEAEVALVVTRRDLIVSTYTVLSTVGRLNADELKITDSLYDPTAHYEEVSRKWWGVSVTHASGRKEFLQLLDDWSGDENYMSK
jgi:outer membrane protein